MSIEDYRKIVDERNASITKAFNILNQLSSNYYSSYVYHAMENLHLAELELRSDLQQHERVDRENEIAKRVKEPMEGKE